MPRPWPCAFAVLSAILSACSASPAFRLEKPPIDLDPTKVEVPGASPAGSGFAAFMATQMASGKIPGLAFAIVKEGRIARLGAFGFADRERGIPATPDTIFRIASISKVVTAVAALQQVEAGVLALNDDVVASLGHVIGNPHHPGPVTLARLLTHTSGIIDNFEVLDPLYPREGDSPLPLAPFVRSYLAPDGAFHRPENFSVSPPGSVASYANMGITTAAAVIQAATRTPFEEITEAGVFRRLGIPPDRVSWREAGFRPSAPIATPYGEDLTPLSGAGYPDWPSGTLRLSASDLARLMIALAGDGSYAGEALLKPETIRRMRDEGLVLYRSNIGTHSVIGHDGGDPGVATEMFFRADGLGVILLTNASAYAPQNEAGRAAMLAMLVKLFDTGAEM